MGTFNTFYFFVPQPVNVAHAVQVLQCLQHAMQQVGNKRLAHAVGEVHPQQGVG